MVKNSGSAEGRELTINEQKAISTFLTTQDDKEKKSVVCLKLVKKKAKMVKDGEIIIVMGLHRIYTFKTGAKNLKSYHLLDITKIQVTSDTEFEITSRNTPPLNIATVQSDAVLKQFCSSWSDAFPGISPPIETTPKERLNSIWKKKKKLGICYNLLKTYSTLCNYLRVPPKQDTIWIVQNVIAPQNIRSFDPNIFNFKDTTDFKAFILSLRYNRWFRELHLKGLKLTKEAITAICEALRTNNSIQEIYLHGIKTSPESFTGIFEAINFNRKSSINSITVNECELEEKSFTSISRYILSSKELETLNLKDTGLTKKSFITLFQHIEKNNAIHGTLKNINLSQNKLEGTQAHKTLGSMLKNLVSLQNLSLVNVGSFKNLDFLTDLTCPIKELNLKGARFNSQNLSQDLVDFVKTASNTLEILCLSRTPVTINVCGEILTHGQKISKLDLSENDFGDKGLSALFQLLGTSKSLKELNLNGNVSPQGKSKNRGEFLRNLKQYLNGNEKESPCTIHTLFLNAGEKGTNYLKTDVIPIFKCLARNTTITNLDISGHSFGDVGTEELAKCLLVNSTLRSLNIDGNNLTTLGFRFLLAGVERNKTLTHLDLPFEDILNAVKQSDKPKPVRKLISSIQNEVEKHSKNQPRFDVVALLNVEQKEQIKSLLLKIGQTSEQIIDISDSRLSYLIEKALGKDTFEKFNGSAQNLAKGHLFELIVHDFQELSKQDDNISQARRRTIEDIKTTLTRKNTTKILLANPSPFDEMGKLSIDVDEKSPKYQVVNSIISQNEQKNLLKAIPKDNNKEKKKTALTRKESKNLMNSFGQIQSIVGPPSPTSVYGTAEPVSADPIKLILDNNIGGNDEYDSKSSDSDDDEQGSSLVYDSSKSKKVEDNQSDDEDEEIQGKDARDEFEESLKLLEGELDFPAPPKQKIDPNEMPQQSGSSLFDLAHL